MSGRSPRIVARHPLAGPDGSDAGDAEAAPLGATGAEREGSTPDATGVAAPFGDPQLASACGQQDGH